MTKLADTELSKHRRGMLWSIVTIAIIVMLIGFSHTFKSNPAALTGILGAIGGMISGALGGYAVAKARFTQRQG